MKKRIFVRLILTTNNYGNDNSEINICHSAPKDIITFPKVFGMNVKRIIMINDIRTIASFKYAIDTYYEWSIMLACYFHNIPSYKNVSSRPKILITFA